MDCEHPYNSVTEERLVFTFAERDETLAKANDVPVRVAVKFCTECSHIIDEDSFDGEFAISHLSDRLRNGDECNHLYEDVEDATITYTLDEKPIEPDKCASVDVKICTNCMAIVDSEADSIPMTTI